MISAYIFSGIAAWIVAQGIKFALSYNPKKKPQLVNLYKSGGMPSGHAASMVAITTVVALKDGTESGLFGLSLILTCIIMYDALMVRRSSGLQGELLGQIAKIVDKSILTPVFAKGHTPLEVVVGAVIGVLVGCVVFFATI